MNPNTEDADVIDVIMAEIVYAVRSTLEGVDTESMLAHSVTSGTTGQDPVLTWLTRKTYRPRENKEQRWKIRSWTGRRIRRQPQ